MKQNTNIEKAINVNNFRDESIDSSKLYYFGVKLILQSQVFKTLNKRILGKAAEKKGQRSEKGNKGITQSQGTRATESKIARCEKSTPLTRCAGVPRSVAI